MTLTENRVTADKSSAGYLAGTQATGAYGYRLVSTADNDPNFSDVRFPHSVRRTVRVGNLCAENDAFSANAALSHFRIPPYISNDCSHSKSARIIIPQAKADCKCFFDFCFIL